MKKYSDIRDAIFGEIYDLAKKDKKTIILSADNGAQIFKKIEQELPDQFFNVGIAEQNATTVAAGLAFTGRRVFIVGIANFVTLKNLEQIQIDVAMMKLPVTILASGTGYFYGEDGPTHHMVNNLSVLRSVPGMTIWIPSSFNMAARLTRLAYESLEPNCIWFDRGLRPESDREDSCNFSDGINIIEKGNDLTIIALGVMVDEALKIREELQKSGLSVGVTDLFRVKPINKNLLKECLKKTKRVVTLEEHTVAGGLGAAVSEFMAERDIVLPIKMFGIPDSFRCEVGDRAYLRSLDKLDAANVVAKIKNWIQ